MQPEAQLLKLMDTQGQARAAQDLALETFQKHHEAAQTCFTAAALRFLLIRNLR